MEKELGLSTLIILYMIIIEVDDPELVKSNIMKKEKEVYDEWKRSFLAISPKEDPMIKVNSCQWRDVL